jgi:hypothetical protein
VAETIGSIASHIAVERPDAFVGHALSDNLTDAPSLYIKGDADSFVRGLIDSAAYAVKLVDNQPFSFRELEHHSQLAHDAIREAGYLHVSTSFDIRREGRITIAVMRQPDLADDVDSILATLPEYLRSRTDITFADGHAPNEKGGAWGGMWVGYSWEGNQCTSGFSVKHLQSQVTGVTTAAHCDGIDYIKHPGWGFHNNFPFQAQHYGQWGDVEWHSSSVAEPAKFYASSGGIYLVLSVEPVAGMGFNEEVCFYGRASNNPACARIVNPSVSCGSVGRLVQLDREVAIEGDSGGPWYKGSKVYGSTYGSCAGQDYFTAADNYFGALGVQVITQ